jgi:hypothetical protein
MTRNMEDLRTYLDLEQHLRDVVQAVGEETAMLYLDLALQRVLLKRNTADLTLNHFDVKI